MTVQHEVVVINTPTGDMRCEIFRPNSEVTSTHHFPTLIFYSEIFQITSPIARTASFYAGHGYVVIVPEVFHELNPIGTVLGYDDEGKEKGNTDKFTKPLSDHDTDTAAIVDWVKKQAFCNGAIGTFGVCLGGHLAFRATLNENILAASCLYATDIHSETMPAGNSPQTLKQLDRIKAEVMCVWGRQDPHVPLEGRKLLYNALADSNMHFSWHEVNGEHAFIRDEGPRYNPELAMLCQRLTLDLFSRSLRR